MEWVDEIYKLVKENRNDAALDILFDHIDDMFLAGKFKECDKVLPTIDLERLNTSLLVGLMMITFAAKDKLTYREQMLINIEDRLKVLAPDRVEKLMIRN